MIKLSKKTRTWRKRYIKRLYGLNRRQLGAIGAGHQTPPAGFDHAMYAAKTTPE